MSDYEHVFSEQESPAEVQLSSGILASGLQPELLAELPVEDAKFMLRSVLKAMSTLAHPDHGIGRSVFGLEIQEINSTSATIAYADNVLFTDVLSKMNSQSTLLAERCENLALTNANEAIYNQANELGIQLISKERPAALITGSIAVTRMPEYSGTDEEAPLDQELLMLQLKCGVVREATVAPAHNTLASKLPTEAQEFIHNLRPNLNADEQLIYIDAATAENTGLPESWCRLVTAKSKTSNKKALGVKIYELANTMAYSETKLIGTKILGRYTATTHDNNLNPLTQQLQDRTLLNLDITKLSGRELARLLAEDHIVLPHSPQELITTNQQPLVFIKQTEQGVHSSGFIVQNPLKLYLSA